VGAPEVTIIIPTHSRFALLSRHALPSALGQEDVDFEVVVVDDASTDETAARLAALDDPRIRVVRHDECRRLAAARNTGVEHARAGWLAFLDDDDIWAPRKLRLQVDAAAAAGAEWVYGKTLVVDEDIRVTDVDPLPAPDEIAGLLLRGNFVPGGGSAVMAKADLVRRAGPFDETLRYFEDWDMWLRMAAIGPPAVCGEVVCARLEHRQNMLSRDRPDVLPHFERLMSKHRDVTQRDRLAIAEWAAFEHHRAGRRVEAARHFWRAARRYRSLGNLPPALLALLGEPGMRLASRLLHLLAGGSHLDRPRPELPPEPAWLTAYR
jgi:glycosyltransferase involved in cell wall biosynthesis